MGFATLSAVDPGGGVQPSRGVLPTPVVHGDVRKCLAAKVAVGEGGPLIGISSRGGWAGCDCRWRRRRAVLGEARIKGVWRMSRLGPLLTA